VHFENILDPKNPYAVYFHRCEGRIFYIGSGALARAFDHGDQRRNIVWNRFVAGRLVSVSIWAFYPNRAEARAEEYAQIARFRPVANSSVDTEPEWSPFELDGWHCARSLSYDTRVWAWPSRRSFDTVGEAARALGVSPSAVCNSISGRFPIVAGLRFARFKRGDHGANEFCEWARRLDQDGGFPPAT